MRGNISVHCNTAPHIILCRCTNLLMSSVNRLKKSGEIVGTYERGLLLSQILMEGVMQMNLVLEVMSIFACCYHSQA